MPERLIVTPLEASTIFLNEIWANPSDCYEKHTPYSGQYSQEMAIALHGKSWKDWYNSNSHPIRPNDYLPDAQRSQLLINIANQVINSLNPEALRRRVRFRVGLEDGIVHSLQEVGREFGLTIDQARGDLDTIRRLQHPSKSQFFLEFRAEMTLSR